MTAQEAYNELIRYINDDKTNRVQFRYTRKHPIKSKRIIERIRRK